MYLFQHNQNAAKNCRIIFVSLVTAFFPWVGYTQPTSTNIQIDASIQTGDMKPFWSWFGYHEPNYTYSNNGKKLLKELKQFSPVKVYVRPQQVTDEQYKKLEQAGQLQMCNSLVWIEASDGKMTLRLDLPKQGVSLMQISW